MSVSPQPSLSSWLRKVPLFAQVEETVLQELATHCRLRDYPAHHPLFFQGDPGYTLFLIVSGSVNIQSGTASGRTLHLARRGPGESIGEMALLTGHPRSADAVTAEPSRLLALERQDFLDCLQRSPGLALNIITCLANRLSEAGQRLESRQELDVLGRLAQLILEMAALHGTEETPEGGERLPIRLTDQQIAERIGSTRATVNRKLSELEAVGAIRKENRQILILDRKRLTRLTGVDGSVPAG